MRYYILTVLLLMPLPAIAQNTPASAAAASKPQAALIRSIEIEGFVLGDKGQFVKLFKPYRNKHLTTADMDAILQEIKNIYEREGYLQLVSITYHVNKHRLIFTASMTT